MSKKPTTLEELAAGASLTGATIPVATVPPVDALQGIGATARNTRKKTPVADELADGELLSAAEKEAIAAEVEEELAAEARAEAAADYKAKLRAELISKNIKHAKDAKGDNVVKLRLELARHVPYVRLDNVVYYPGYEYDVKPEVAVVLKDQMYRSYLHDAEISGLNINDYLGRRTALAVVSG